MTVRFTSEMPATAADWFATIGLGVLLGAYLIFIMWLLVGGDDA